MRKSASFIGKTGLIVASTAALTAGLTLGKGALAGPGSFQQAVSEYQAGKYSSALEKFKAFTASYPNNAISHYYLALCHQALGHIEQAKQEYQATVQYGDANLKQMGARGLAILGGAKTQISYAGTSTAAPTRSNAAPSQAKGKVRKIYEFYADW